MSRRLQIVIFFSTALTVYGLLNFYVFSRGMEIISSFPSLRGAYAALFSTFALSFIAGRFLERVTLSWPSHAMVWLGSLWLGAFVYLLLAVMCIDIVRLANVLVPFIPATVAAGGERVHAWIGLSVLAFVVLVVAGGYVNASRPRVRTLDLTVPKNSQSLKALNIVAVSDMHLGSIIGKRRLENIVSMVNALNPDIVLLPGDVFDEDIGPVINQNLGETLRNIRAPRGIFFCTGNHEFFGGIEAAERYLTDHGIVVLRDAAVDVEGEFVVVGREDITGRQFGGPKRRSLEELLSTVDKRKPIILMDHQPFHLEEAERNGVDLQLSGHTHHGQLWPFNYITRKVYEISWGYIKKGSTHIYVSSGAGTWGPPMRTGNTPEIVNVRLKFT